MLLQYSMLRLSLARDTTNPTMKQIAKRIKMTVQVYDDASVRHLNFRQMANWCSFLTYCCTEFHDLLYPTPNVLVSGAAVRSTEASLRLAG